jgi:sulfur-carrier protein adenylyltransferase/sulfurtransferase
VLEDAGFPQVVSMKGGIRAWSGLVAEGEYNAGLAYFSRSSDVEVLLALSWSLEEGNRIYYDTVAAETRDEDAASLFRALAGAEGRHKDSLRAAHARRSGSDKEPVAPDGMEPGTYLEGGSRVSEAVAWSRGRRLDDVLEYAVAMEANSLDRYVKMARAAQEPESREMFLELSGEERTHVQRMASQLDRLRGAR